ncbi:hypothetical protein AYP1020_p17 (plasmid) [Staphylococcus capitis subsp. capitis]|jgi:hypothetical protein|nr:hypothetical protein AYP1020_p17 [Staphylococcus capitis subsp. capitis]
MKKSEEEVIRVEGTVEFEDNVDDVFDDLDDNQSNETTK